MLTISYRNEFKIELKKQKKRGKNLEKFILVAELIASEQQLPGKYRNHQSNWKFQRSMGVSHRTRLAFNLFKNFRRSFFERNR